jgi:hypothetical protein
VPPTRLCTVIKEKKIIVSDKIETRSIEMQVAVELFPRELKKSGIFDFRRRRKQIRKKNMKGIINIEKRKSMGLI